MTDNEQQQKQKQPQDQRKILVSYGKMATMGWFENKAGEIEKIRTRVVIKTQRGLEIGDVVGQHCYKHGHFRCSKKQVADYYPDRTKEYPISGGGVMVRYATEEDIMEAHHLDILAKNELKTCQKLTDEMKLPMKIVDAEHLLGGERIIFYFISENRVDFRELVKRLAREFQTRIELRQIGSRDEARIIGDYESCGLECCCRRFLKILAPVNMRMAKVQKATLDPSKISGHCGRLKCCLRYEDETYKVLKNKLPKKNMFVETEGGIGRVVDAQILTQLVMVEMQDGKVEAYPVDETKVVKDKDKIEKARRPQKPPQQQRPDRKRGGRNKPEQNKDNAKKADVKKPNVKKAAQQDKPAPQKETPEKEQSPKTENKRPEKEDSPKPENKE